MLAPLTVPTLGDKNTAIINIVLMLNELDEPFVVALAESLYDRKVEKRPEGLPVRSDPYQQAVAAREVAAAEAAGISDEPLHAPLRSSNVKRIMKVLPLLGSHLLSEMARIVEEQAIKNQAQQTAKCDRGTAQFKLLHATGDEAKSTRKAGR